MSIPLEDTFTDIIGKPIRGHKLDEAAVAQRAGLTLADLQTLRGGEFNAAVAEKVAPVSWAECAGAHRDRAETLHTRGRDARRTGAV